MQENIQSQINSNQDEISLKELILKLKEWGQYLLSKWLIILIASVLGGVLGFGYSFIKKPSYNATLTFALEEDNSGNLGVYSGLASQFGIDFGGGGGAFSGDNILELMKSRSMVQRTLLSTVVINGKQLTLADYYIGFNDLKRKWKDNPELEKISFPVNADPLKFTRLQDSLLGKFHEIFTKKNLSVDKIDKKLSVIAVKCNFTDELFAKVFTEALVYNVTDFYIKTKTGRSQKNVAILQHKSDSLRRALDGALYGRALDADRIPNLNPVKQVAAVSGQKKQVDIQVISSAYSEVLKNLELSKLALSRDTPFIQIIDTPIVPLPKEYISSLTGIILGMVISFFFTGFFLIGSKIYKEILD